MKKLYIGTNTKMYKTISQTTEFLKRLEELTADIPAEELFLFVIPSFTALEKAKSVLHRVQLGAQNMCWEDEGQFTGEISPLMLKEIGVSITEIGHSERRHVFGERDEEEHKKVLASLRHGFIPLLCVGETLEQKNYGIADEILKIQLKVAFNGIPAGEIKKCMVAYEPVWAIGTSGIPATKEYAKEKHSVIRETLTGLCGESTGGSIPILYGGSVNNENAGEFIGMDNIDGLFIGRSAWQADNFNTIIRMVLPIFKEK